MNLNLLGRIAFLGAVSFSLAVPAVSAGTLLRLDVNTSRYMEMPSPIQRIAIGNPDIATIVEIPDSETEFLLVAHKPGTTSLFIWSEYGERFEYTIGVSPEDVGLAALIENSIGLPNVHVKMVDGKVLLTGTVKDQYERNYALRTAQLYVKGAGGNSISVGSNVNLELQAQNATQNSGGTVGGATSEDSGAVIDLLHMISPTQVRLEAQVVAINPEDKESLGFHYSGALSSSGISAASAPGIFFGGESYRDGSGRTPYRNNINVAIEALVTQSRAKILSRPSITTMSGEAAVIQVGGQIPYTTRDSTGVANTSYKDYGIILQFRPLVDAENRIVSSIHTEISKPNGETVDGQPVLERRRTDSVVTVSPGSTMIIGGLMDSSESKIVSKIPFLGDIPVIGEFFKYTSKTKDKQELVVLITPYLVDEREQSVTRMSQDMKEYYKKGQKEEQSREVVDVEQLHQEAAEEAEASKPKPKDDEGSILHKDVKKNY